MQQICDLDGQTPPVEKQKNWQHKQSQTVKYTKRVILSNYEYKAFDSLSVLFIVVRTRENKTGFTKDN